MAKQKPVIMGASGNSHDPITTGDVIDPAYIPVSVEAGNSITMKPDGLYGTAGAGGIQPTTNTIVFESDGSSNQTQYDWVVPAGVNYIKVRMVGGGGGSGGGGTNIGGAGGSGAGYLETYMHVTPGQSITVMVGLGGAGGAGTTPAGSGLTGETTQLLYQNTVGVDYYELHDQGTTQTVPVVGVILTANGGSGGVGGGSQSNAGIAGLGGEAQGLFVMEGDDTPLPAPWVLSIDGQRGFNGAYEAAQYTVCGSGGGSYLGPMMPSDGNTVQIRSREGSKYGGGAAAHNLKASGTANTFAGAKGGDGVVIIDY